MHALTASAYSSPNLIGILVYPPGTRVVTVTDQWDDDDKRRRQQQHLTASKQKKSIGFIHGCLGQIEFQTTLTMTHQRIVQPKQQQQHDNNNNKNKKNRY